MKMYCIADNQEIELGFKLAGCDGITLNEKKDIILKIEEIEENQDVGVLVLTNNIYQLSKEKVDKIRLNKKIPLVAII